ncbi:MAG: LPS export ABC transporter periplasmic protein LptC [Marinifilaceae bacterium]|nr:LPS export ABC transporter periplasmic protein LptC [Marinifilaceae bacterium]
MKTNILILKSIVVVFTTAMLFSCSNDIKEVEKYIDIKDNVNMYGKDIKLVYSDSLIVRYKLNAKEYLEQINDKKIERVFPKGVFIRIFDNKGDFSASIKADIAKYNPTNKVWKLSNNVTIITSDGDTIKTEEMFWDHKNSKIYGEKYVRITHKDGNYIEGNDGFFANESNLENAEILGEIKGKFEI